MVADPRVETERVDIEATRNFSGTFSAWPSYSTRETSLLGLRALDKTLGELLQVGSYSGDRMEFVMESGQSLTMRWQRGDEQLLKRVYLIGKDFTLGSDNTIELSPTSQTEQVKLLTSRETTRLKLYINSSGDLVVVVQKKSVDAGLISELLYLPFAGYAESTQVAMFPRVIPGMAPAPPAPPLGRGLANLLLFSVGRAYRSVVSIWVDGEWAAELISGGKSCTMVMVSPGEHIVTAASKGEDAKGKREVKLVVEAGDWEVIQFVDTHPMDELDKLFYSAKKREQIEQSRWAMTNRKATPDDHCNSPAYETKVVGRPSAAASATSP
jgi:hypothetical protein